MYQVLDKSGIVNSGQEMMNQEQNNLYVIFMEDYDDRFKKLWLYRDLIFE